MSQYSKKRKSQLRQYKKLRILFLAEFPLCEICGGIATTVHHKKGRMGKLLIDTEFFLPACMPCHEKVELEPEWAKEKGYLL